MLQGARWAYTATRQFHLGKMTAFVRILTPEILAVKHVAKTPTCLTEICNPLILVLKAIRLLPVAPPQEPFVTCGRNAAR